MFRKPLFALAAVAALAAAPVHAQPAAGGHSIQARLQQVHDKLGITPAQQPQWDAVVAALRENAQAMRDNPARQAERAGNLNAVQSLHAAADLARARADALGRMVPPVEALYASLTPEQQRVADQTLSEAMHARRGRRG